jgi:hypothetical protein
MNEERYSVRKVCDAKLLTRDPTLISCLENHMKQELFDELSNHIFHIARFSAGEARIVMLSNVKEVQRFHLDEKELRQEISVRDLVLCKDCKWKQGAECVRFAEIRPFPDDFCSRGERREDDGKIG